MTKYIALLRGINVGGKNKIKMASLRECMEKNGLQNVQSYIQSGNLIFNSEEHGLSNLEIKISLAINKCFNLEIPVVVLKRETLIKILEDNPFNKDEDLASNKVYFVVLQKTPDLTNIQKMNEYSFENETFKYSSKCVYLYCALGAGKAKCNNNFFEAKLKVQATTRNYRTLSKLIELSVS